MSRYLLQPISSHVPVEVALVAATGKSVLQMPGSAVTDMIKLINTGPDPWR